MRIWLDDIRSMPESYDVHCKTAGEAIAHIKTGVVTHISLDHDLDMQHYETAGQGDGTGYDVARFIELEMVKEKPAFPMPTWAIHSMNPAGKLRMRLAMEQADRLNTARQENNK